MECFLARLFKSMSLKQFVESQFEYCPHKWMFHNRKINRKINHLQERFLRILYDDSTSSFEDLPKKDNSSKIHHKKIQSLAIELFKVFKGISNPILYIFPLRPIDYNLKYQTDVSISRANACHFALNPLQYFVSKVWNVVSPELKNLNNFEMFESEIRKWEPTHWKCKFFLPYIQNIGYVNISKAKAT